MQHSGLCPVWQIEVSSSVHPELLAGLRGAGTVFGVVTEMTLQLFSGTSDVYAGSLVLPDAANFTNLKQADSLQTHACRMSQRLTLPMTCPATQSCSSV